MEEKINELEQRIKKAIKFIENNMYENYCYVGSEEQLLKILKGLK